MLFIQVECRMEEYPVSRALVSLLEALSAAAPLPRALGAGTRTPGLDPYVDYVLNQLALPAPHRSYAKPHEKWEMLSLCFRLFVRWLEQYEPSPSDFPPTGREPDANPPPGFRLLVQLHTKSELLRLLLTSLDEAHELLDGQPGQSREFVEQSLVSILQLLERALSLERALNSAAVQAGRGVLLVGLSKLILEPEGPENCCRLVTCCRVVSHGPQLARAAAGAVSVLRLALHAPAAARHLLALLTHKHARAAEVRHGFVECLEAEEYGDDEETASLRQAKEGIVMLLHELLPTAPPNLAHFLLGYQLTDDSASAVTISARSWVVRACASSCGAAGAARQVAALSALLHALAHAPAAAHTHTAQDWEWCLLRRLIEDLPMSVEETPEPRWELFQPNQLRQAIASCDLHTGMGGKRISVSRVLALLTRELAALNATAPQRNLVSLEIQKVLDYVTEVNHQRNLAATLTHYYDSWRQLTEILFCVVPHDILDVESRKTLLLNILQDLLNKIQPNDVLPQIGNLASGTVLLLLVNLRHCYILQKRESNLKTSDFETSFFGPSNQIMQTNSLTLKFILKKILSWILVSGGSTQKMRVNLYGALLNYLNIVNLKHSPADPEEDVNSTYVSRLDSSKVKSSREESSLRSMAIDVISDFGENLCTIVCSDCIGAGHDVCRMVALSCLDMLIEINPRTDWMNTLTNQGYLRSLIDSLLQDDEGLKEALEPQPKSLRVLYVYESKMALLIKLAASRAGAETVLSQGALASLANLSALDCHPDIHTGYNSHKDTEFVPSVANRWKHRTCHCIFKYFYRNYAKFGHIP
ncbi:hypothetical protein O3G_MSEX013862 [Manduca sexta]|uniref:Uncharacterized protein n=1 Tax=Manduca sexta TaxID=7130 RepID=A0A921ZUG0_MANSE|nr:hypothetical protein O3G_MSEX013862 [Manduca sexta]